MNNLKQLGLALHNYESANNVFPSAAIYGIGRWQPVHCSSPGFGNNCQNTPWFVLMLPTSSKGHSTMRSTRRSASRVPISGLAGRFHHQ